MRASVLKMLFRKKGTALSTIAFALLVAILASTASIINDFNSQTEALAGLPNIGGTYLILTENSSSIADNKIDTELAAQLNGIADIEYIISQKIFTTTLTDSSGDNTILVRGVENVTNFLNHRKANVNGTIAKNETEANIGEILARSISINLGDKATLNVSDRKLQVKVVGIVRTITQADAELIVPMEAATRLTGNNDKLSLIEFVLKENVDAEEAINRITGLLPRDMKVVEVQMPKEFMQDVNRQTLTFLNVWVVAVYAVVAAASYVVATRLITENSYELTMLEALGAKKSLLFTLVPTYIATTALIGCILGLALGIAGTQTASTMLGWVWPSVEANPFLEPSQALQTLLLTLASSTLGCLFPAFRNMNRTYMEQPL